MLPSSHSMQSLMEVALILSLDLPAAQFLQTVARSSSLYFPTIKNFFGGGLYTTNEEYKNLLIKYNEMLVKKSLIVL